MDERILTALKGSIAKWEGIVAGTVEDDGGNNCPLCQLFNDGENMGCHGCPVMGRTGRPLCQNSPYYEYEDGNAASGQAELDFLRSLLPEDAA